MRYDHLIEAVSEGEPCGPDLDEVGDDAYLNYVLPASDRLPERFFDRDTGAPFDRSAIDLKTEVKTISALLERSRDLRLLALEARFQCLAGQPVGFSECLQAMEALIENRWEEVHPRASDGDLTLRQNTLSALDDRATIILPLEFAPLASDKRTGSVCLRDFRVANGELQPREGEEPADLASVLEVMRQEGSRDSVESTYEAARAAERALTRIRSKFLDAASYEYAPSFDGLQEALGHMRAFLEAALPHLAAAPQPASEPGTADEPAPAKDGADSTASSPGEAAAGGIPAAQVPDHGAATAALIAVERYFTSTEPSSPALILVHQARTLVGQPLVVALDALLPEISERALISVDHRAGLQLAMPRMRSITEAVGNGAVGSEEGMATHDYAATTRQEAESLIHGVEAFFRKTEPSSPIPMLLARARTFMNRDFSAILVDLIRNSDQELSS